MSSVVLALDTSTAIASVALYDGAVSGEVTWRSGRNHSVELMVQAQGLMKLRGVDPSQLVAVAVATGPGSYTGLRVGLSAAKGLCLALGLPMVGVCSLDILAEAQRDSCLPIRPLLDAGRHRFATALYRMNGAGLERVSPIEGLRLPEVLDRVKERTLICGDVAELSAVDLGSRAALFDVAGPASSLRRAGFLAEIGWKRYHSGDVQEASEVDAFYLSKEEP
ncbi:MAG TPA: tRNA (adenosine(37)-N6)-threonylcarbamoyltransferase complex dimerization subunit type 1 TsaB [Chloroflexota bacterium]|nr:tRNA (adenosine(37)-N6)-threonylcarbamoyltransferase complex dimerization subunit type 1 TsaB [Chloroflexota bacterium]HEX2987007.1 tRNA (adenosine(37)-N6)-threonylcarbamoyltransferase complex dimerization subunit type 1 TsaB [Chloroflexota bacterium]